QNSLSAGLPQIQVSAPQGKLLRLLASTLDARQILEIGTLAGYSTLWMAGGLSAAGRIVTLEIDAKHAKCAQQNFEQAGIAGKVDLRVGSAMETLAQLHTEKAGHFDLCFIDAD